MSDRPLVQTDRLELWRPRLGDMPGLVELIAAEETRRFLGAAKAEEKSQFEKLMRNVGGWALYGYGNFYVRLHGRPGIIASCGVFHTWRGFGQGMDDVPEAGWIVHRDHWGQGIAGEAMRAALGWFDATHGPQRIAAMIEDGNTASVKVAAALGFAEYGRQQFEGSPVVLYERIARREP